MFLNRGPEARPQFVDVRDAVGLKSGENTRGVALVDLDGDGTAGCGHGESARAALALPQPARGEPGNAWVALESRGRRQAVQPGGAGQPGHRHHTRRQRQVQQKQAITGLAAQGDRRLHFGLGPLASSATVDVEVRWCGALGPTSRYALKPGRSTGSRCPRRSWAPGSFPEVQSPGGSV